MPPAGLPLLLTKLHVPEERSQWVPRPRLFETLERAHTGQALLLSAPAGYGKTVLLGQWISHLRSDSPQNQLAWLTLDDQDNDPVRFWSYLAAALQSCLGGSQLGNAFLDILQAPQPLVLEQALVLLMNEIAQVPAKIILVLDDVQVITNKQVHTGLGYFIEHLPANLLLVMAGRGEPPLPLARYRARGMLVDVHTSDLRFDRPETAALLQAFLPISLSEPELALLDQRVEGWAAGLQLAAISMTGVEDKTTFIKTFTGSDRYILDYLTQEILHMQPVPVQEFLLKTSILDRMNAPLCEATLGESGVEPGSTQQILEFLDRSNLFIIPLDNQRTWYRYHRLFSDLLQAQLAHKDAQLPAELHRRAAQWLIANRLPAEAFRHAIAAGDLGIAAGVVRDQMGDLVQRGESSTLQAWLAEFSQDYVIARPDLCLGFGWLCLYHVQFDQAESWALRTKSALLASGEPISEQEQQSYLGQVDAIRATVAANRDRREESIELSKSALDKLPDSLNVLRGLLYLNLGDVYNMVNYDFAAAARAYEDSLDAGRPAGNHIMDVVVIGGLGELYFKQGRLHQAETILQQAFLVEKDQLAQGGSPLLSCGKPLVSLARIQLEWNNIEEALSLAEKSVDYCRQWRHPSHWLEAVLIQADVSHVAGERAAAWEGLEQARTLVEQFARSSPTRTPQASYQDKLFKMELTFHIREGNLQAAERLLSSQPSKPGRTDQVDPTLLAGHALLAILGGSAENGLSEVEKILEISRKHHWLRLQINGSLLHAMADQELGDLPGAIQYLEQALDLAVPEDYVRMFVDKGIPVRKLLERELQELEKSKQHGQDARRAYLGKLLSSFPGAVPRRLDAPPRPNMDLPVGGLSDRERQVLRLLAAGLSNDDIGSELFLSTNTVKTHLKRIFEKLGVNNRMEAVNKARDSRWI